MPNFRKCHLPVVFAVFRRILPDKKAASSLTCVYHEFPNFPFHYSRFVMMFESTGQRLCFLIDCVLRFLSSKWHGLVIKLICRCRSGLLLAYSWDQFRVFNNARIFSFTESIDKGNNCSSNVH